MDARKYKMVPDDHVKLVSFTIRKLGYYDTSDEVNMDEIHSAGYFGLVKACLGFNPVKAAWTTYAMKCITNEIFMAHRKEKKYLPSVLSSINEVVMSDSNGNDLTYSDILQSQVSVSRKVLNRMAMADIIQFADETLEGRELQVFNCFRADCDVKQDDMCKQLGISQPAVSRILKRIRVRLRRRMQLWGEDVLWN